MSEIQSRYQIVYNKPYEPFDPTIGHRYKKINQECEIVRINSKEDCEKISKFRHYDKISNGPFQKATLIEFVPQDKEGRYQDTENYEVITVKLGNGEILRQVWNREFGCYSFYFRSDNNINTTKVTFTFVSGSCINHEITDTFVVTDKISDIKKFITEYIKNNDCSSKKDFTITLVCNEAILKNDDQLIETLGETANITVRIKFLGGGRKSRRRKTNKNKRIRRKSMKRLHRRK
jgi:hypothetical protein